MFSECIRGTRRLRSLSDLRARPARTSPLTCMFADRIPGTVRNAGEARAAASLAARFGRQTGPRSGRRCFSREYLRTCMYQQSFISILFATPLLPFYVPTFRPFCPPVERTYFDLYCGVGVLKERRFDCRWNLYR